MLVWSFVIHKIQRYGQWPWHSGSLLLIIIIWLFAFSLFMSNTLISGRVYPLPGFLNYLNYVIDCHIRHENMASWPLALYQLQLLFAHRLKEYNWMTYWSTNLSMRNNARIYLFSKSLLITITVFQVLNMIKERKAKDMCHSEAKNNKKNDEEGGVCANLQAASGFLWWNYRTSIWFIMIIANNADGLLC